jgi:hypothetical protein
MSSLLGHPSSELLRANPIVPVTSLGTSPYVSQIHGMGSVFIRNLVARLVHPLSSAFAFTNPTFKV